MIIYPRALPPPPPHMGSNTTKTPEFVRKVQVMIYKKLTKSTPLLSRPMFQDTLSEKLHCDAESLIHIRKDKT